jgi:16S rRNA (cytidine1402-2'-O)-methyltransferase
VALVSDAGTPAINDPGYELVRAALAAGFDVQPVPGPSAPIAALTVSGLPTDAFLYLGYLPHKSGDRRKALAQIDNLRYTLIFLETPHRLLDALADLLSVLGDRRISVSRELTKLYEETWRGSISGAIEYFTAREPRGEFTLVVEGRQTVDGGRWTEEQLLAAIQDKAQSGKSASQLAGELADQSGWKKKEVYSLILKQ